MSEKLFNRELSWLEFNSRVLAEAMDPSNPLLERLKFIGIVSSNFDEFFMVRVASLENDGDKMTKKIIERANETVEKENQYFQNVMVPELEKSGIVRVPLQALNDRQKDYLKDFFRKELFPVLTPIALSEDKPVPALVSLSLYSVIGVLKPGQKTSEEFAVIEMPKNFPRIIALPADSGYPFVLIEDIVSLFAQELFVGCEIKSQGQMRLTRGAELSLDEEKDEDFAKVMTEALRMRMQSEVVRLEVSASDKCVQFLKKELKITDDEVFKVNSWFDLKTISQLAYQPTFPELKRPAWSPRPVADFENADSVWDLLKKKDVSIILPYDSFDPVIRLLNEAANDPDVLAIKQTLYRTGSESMIVDALARAAENGKRVTALVELKARFDEEKNIKWAKRLEISGASVLYGISGLKTHAKACLIVRREPDGIKRYVHLSTGNYNEKTALIYSDIALFSSNEDLASDVSAFFNVITGYSEPTALTKIEIAPYGLKRRLLRMIRREEIRSKEKPGLIMAKMNSLVDPEIIEALYKASQAGCQIKLNVRGICCLRPGVKGLSENIEVISIVDMFLEHARIFYFHNGGDEEVYLSSADWMPRNLDRRIEIMFPVENKEIKNSVIDLIKLYFKDNQKSWRLLPEGNYEKIEPGEHRKFRVQEYLCAKAVDRDDRENKSAPKELKPQKPK